MQRAIIYNDDGRTIRLERGFREIKDWDLPEEMKLWFEYPEATRFARYPYDILYTPIFFGNAGISGDLCLEVNKSKASEIHNLTAEISLIGGASLGLLNIGGRPANIYDTRFAFSMVGFRPIVTIPVMDIYDTVTLSAGAYESNDIVGRRVPFIFNLPVSTLAELHELTPSLKLISSDTETTLDVLKDQSPTLLLNVKYLIQAILYNGSTQVQKIEQEIRIWVALDREQVPTPMVQQAEHVHRHRRSSLVPLKRGRSFSLSASTRRKSVHQGNNHVIVEADDPEPLCFKPDNDAAATKVVLTLTFAGDDASERPGPVQGTVEWLMKSLSTVAVQANDRPEDAPPSDDAFHLRTKHLPVKKLKLNWTDWSRDEVNPKAWTAIQDLWLTQPTTSGLTPTFRTSSISHSYSMALNISLSGKGLKGKSYKVDLNIPVVVRYDVGLAPSYTGMDASLPHYSVDEGVHTEQAGPPPDHPDYPIDYADVPPPHHDDAPTLRRQVPRYTPNELAEMIRTIGLEETIHEEEGAVAATNGNGTQDEAAAGSTNGTGPVSEAGSERNGTSTTTTRTVGDVEIPEQTASSGSTSIPTVAQGSGQRRARFGPW